MEEPMDAQFPTDTQGGLMWTPTKPDRMTYREALEVVERLNREQYAGHVDWRLPTIEELIRAVDYSRSDPATTLPDTQSGIYWSASSLAPRPTWAWVVCFDSGGVNLGDKTGQLLRSSGARE